MKQHIAKQLRKFPFLHDFLQDTYRFFRPTLVWRIERALRGLPEVFFVQVGSNDGVQGDPIHFLIRKHPHWRGLFIEPVRFAFERLQRNYPETDRFRFENVAIGDGKGKRLFYYVTEQAKENYDGELPFWYDQLGSFNREHIVRHLGRSIEPFIVSEEAPCLPLPEVLARHRIERVDLFHIDTEGFDYHILRQINLDKHKPRVILFEHHHLDDSEKQQALVLLENAAYRLFMDEADCLAIQGG